MSNHVCNHVLRDMGEAYPRTCRVCGLFGQCSDPEGQQLQLAIDMGGAIGLHGLHAASKVQAFDVVHKAEHYNVHPSGIECIDIIRHMNFNMGCVTKYIMRRHGKEYERSIKSALYYLDDQHTDMPMPMVNLPNCEALLRQYAELEPVPTVRNLYIALIEYLQAPSAGRYLWLRRHIVDTLEHKL